MKKLLLSILATGLFATPVLAAPYVSGSVGLGSLSNSSATSGGLTINDVISYKSGVPFAVAVGIKNDGYRVEVALGSQSNDVDKMKEDGVNLTSVSGSSVSIVSYLVNGYYDIDVKSSFTPYVTAGIGGASLTVKSKGSPDESQSVFAYQLGAGIGIKASESVVFDLGYRYIKPSAFKVKDLADISTTSSNFLVGVRYSF